MTFTGRLILSGYVLFTTVLTLLAFLLESG